MSAVYYVFLMYLFGFKILEFGFMVGVWVMACQLPKAAGRNWFLIGMGILIWSILINGLTLSGLRMVYPEVLALIGLFGGVPAWFCLFMGIRKMVGVLALVEDSTWPALATGRFPRRGTSLLIMGIFGLLLWPIAPYVRVQSRRDLSAIDAGEIDESQRVATVKASALGWLGTLLLIGGGLAILIILLALVFEWAPSNGVGSWG
ncbi:MAG: hypothetical protein MK106_02885 [Mariniblastus sp.]|nr:hypothetical protein [Mariniblastus sp.]